MTILGTGLTGLVGSRLTELLNKDYDFEDVSLENGINILDKESVYKKISTSSSSIVLHMAAKTNVDGCELDKIRDKQILEFENEEKEKTWAKEQTAWAINVEGT